MADPIVFNGTVEWSGENPGISLKETPDGPFVVLASFFRVVLSPHGQGHVLVLLQSPHEANPRAERGNYCLHDNEALARFVVTDFVSNFGPSRASLVLAVWSTGGSTASRLQEIRPAHIQRRRSGCAVNLDRPRWTPSALPCRRTGRLPEIITCRVYLSAAKRPQ